MSYDLAFTEASTEESGSVEDSENTPPDEASADTIGPAAPDPMDQDANPAAAGAGASNIGGMHRDDTSGQQRDVPEHDVSMGLNAHQSNDPHKPRQYQPYNDQGEETLSPVAALIDELTSEDLQSHINAIKQLSFVANALGPERTRNELIPYLSQIIEQLIDDEDEVLVTMTDQIFMIAEKMENAQELHHILMPFERLCVVEDSAVRNKAVQHTLTICERIPEEHVVRYVASFSQRLLESDWPIARRSGALLTCGIYKHINTRKDIQNDIIQHVTRLKDDEDPSVRGVVANCIGVLAPQVSPEIVKTKLFPAFLTLIGDEQDAVRLKFVEIISTFAQFWATIRSSPSNQNDDHKMSGPDQDNLIFDDEEMSKRMLLAIRQSCMDNSWRVRCVAADNFPKICDMLGEKAMHEQLLSTFVQLLKDPESEVRTMATSRLAEVAVKVGARHTMEHLMPVAQMLVKDDCKHCRTAFANSIMGVCAVISKEDAIDTVLPIILTILRDQNQEVRLGCIHHFVSHGSKIGLEKIRETLIPVIFDLGAHDMWRVRHRMIGTFPHLAKELGREIFLKFLLDQLLSWISDPVCAVRTSACKVLAQTVTIFGEKWCFENIVPTLSERVNSPDQMPFHTRMSVTKTLGEMLKLTSLVNGIKLVNLLATMANDGVANVRMTVSKQLHAVKKNTIPMANKDGQVGVLSAESLLKVNDILKRLTNDEDIDVRYFAGEGLQINAQSSDASTTGSYTNDTFMQEGTDVPVAPTAQPLPITDSMDVDDNFAG